MWMHLWLSVVRLHLEGFQVAQVCPYSTCKFDIIHQNVGTAESTNSPSKCIRAPNLTLAWVSSVSLRSLMRGNSTTKDNVSVKAERLCARNDSYSRLWNSSTKHLRLDGAWCIRFVGTAESLLLFENYCIWSAYLYPWSTVAHNPRGRMSEGCSWWGSWQLWCLQTI